MSRMKSVAQADVNHRKASSKRSSENCGLLPPDIQKTSDGTEYEDTGIARPFNPVLINITSKQMSLDTLIKRIREGEVDLAPNFQRSDVWKPKAKSRLIESLLIRIPLPAFYMDATDDEKWLVVDGLQRLSTLKDFVINKTMVLQELEFLTQFNKDGYDALPRNFQRRIEETQVTVYLIEKGTPPEVKFNIFKRINTGGLPLSAQEIRHALNQGPVTAFLKALADSGEFTRATHDGVSDERMAARECVLRFFAFILTPFDKYKPDDFDTFLNKAMEKLNTMSEDEREKLARRFIRALDAAHTIFGRGAFRKPSRNNRKSPVNKALFEVCTVTMDKQSDETLQRLEASRTMVTKKVIDFMQSDAEFINAISQGTGDVARVRRRFSSFERVIEEALL